MQCQCGNYLVLDSEIDERLCANCSAEIMGLAPDWLEIEREDTADDLFSAHQSDCPDCGCQTQPVITWTNGDIAEMVDQCICCGWEGSPYVE